MMFLEFFVWGSWYVTMGTFLGNNLQSTGSGHFLGFFLPIFGAIHGPFYRWVDCGSLFSCSENIGIHPPDWGRPDVSALFSSENFAGFFPVLLAYMILFMPTLALVNSISFNQMKNPEKEFSVIRVWGTIGWVTAGLLISAIWLGTVSRVSEGLLKNTWIMASIVSLGWGFIVLHFLVLLQGQKLQENSSFQKSWD
jgi:hypothetical protein